MSIEDEIELRVNRMLERDAKAYDHWCDRADKAEEMIGELSSGVCYIYPAGGRYRQGTRDELVDFLIRNKYV